MFSSHFSSVFSFSSAAVSLLFLFVYSTVCLPYSVATISPAFSDFLTVAYGDKIEESIARRDLGSLGSFGGGTKVPMFTRKRPIVMVHGLSTFAAEYENIRQYFLMNNYTDAEVYASSYGHGPVNWTHDAMKCEHVQRFRWLMLAVANYTSSQIDVIGYSMGSPIARKVFKKQKQF
ncbi:hypothetical protein niasHT_004796 [Heterodera trifolii]|uniref:Triacylglycerol lipase n=1 Tax=Heterodera trifolii TaxID=157864 RepID=A0ABD2M9K9_9BILA